MKSYTNKNIEFLTAIYSGIFRDAIDAFPTIRNSEWRKDINRSLFLLRNRGLGFFTLDLPSLDDTLLNVLSTGQYKVLRPMFSNGQKPSFLRGIWSLIIDDNGRLLDQPNPDAIFFIRQFANFAKKAAIPCSKERMEAKFNEYIRIEKDLRTPSKRWFTDDFYGPAVDDDATCYSVSGQPDLFGSIETCTGNLVHLTNLQSIADHFSIRNFEGINRYVSNNGSLSLSRAFAGTRSRTSIGRHGPGASAEGSKYLDKFAFKRITPNMSSLLYSTFMDGGLNDLHHIVMYNQPTRTVLPSRVVLVPKDSRGPRVIAAEPVLSQFAQQMGFAFIQSVVRSTCLRGLLDFQDQGLSKLMARQGSIGANLATIDLRNASDRLSLHLVERLFRFAPSFLRFLHGTRSMNSSYDGIAIPNLRKFASQGNAITFPLQSVIYLFIALAACTDKPIRNVEGFIRRHAGRVRTFGDDIIIPNDRATHVSALLEAVGLEINPTKSFSTGFFRESCGGDFYKGYNVTPLKVRRVDINSPEGQQSIIDVSNLAHSMGLWRTAEITLSYFRHRSGNGTPSKCFIPVGSDGDGLISYSGYSHEHLKSRWSEEYHRTQVKTWSLHTKVKRVHRPFRSRISMACLTDLTRPGAAVDTAQDYASRERFVWDNAFRE